MKKSALILILLLPLFLLSQDNSEAPSSKSGEFELGLRSTTSLFGSSGNPGYGFGGQFRIRMSNRVNTEWFADFITEDIDGLATRHDYHIGWSVMFYPLDPMDKKLLPYILAGHCFDYTAITPVVLTANAQEASRLSSATQVGIGVHYYFSDNINLSFSSQYMLHLGQDIHTEIHQEEAGPELHIEKHGHDGKLSLEGHTLFTLSLNIKLGKLW